LGIILFNDWYGFVDNKSYRFYKVIARNVIINYAMYYTNIITPFLLFITYGNNTPFFVASLPSKCLRISI